MYESAREGSERELAAASHDVYMKVQENLQQRSMYVITPPHPTISYEDFKKTYKTLVRFSTRRHKLQVYTYIYILIDLYIYYLYIIIYLLYI